MNYLKLSNFLQLVDKKKLAKISKEGILKTVRYLTLGLYGLLNTKGEGVGIIVNPSPYWLVVILAIMLADGKTVPVFNLVNSQEADYANPIDDTRIMFISRRDEVELVHQYAKGVDKIIPLGITVKGDDILPFTKLVDDGKSTEAAFPKLFDKLMHDIHEFNMESIQFMDGKMFL